MSTPLANIDEIRIAYNNLPGVLVANQRLSKALGGGEVTPLLDSLLKEFSESGGRFCVWLAHRHFSLNEGELMVEEGNIMEPRRITDPSLQFEAARWSSTLFPLEHRLPNQDPAQDSARPLTDAPSPEFMEKFREILTEYNIAHDLLGVGYAEMPEEGYIFLEMTSSDNGKRRHITTQVRRDSMPSDNMICTSWIPLAPASSSESKILYCAASHVCIGHTDTTVDATILVDKITMLSTSAPTALPRN